MRLAEYSGDVRKLNDQAELETILNTDAAYSLY